MTSTSACGAVQVRSGCRTMTGVQLICSECVHPCMMTSSNSHGGRKPDPSGSLFDTWLQTRLQRQFDEALEEAVPDDLLQLLPEPEKRSDH